jgi:Domain of unknown function (DUF4203)
MQGTFIGLLTLVIGIILCFGGHRFFRVMMVAVGFTGGFVLGGSGVAAFSKGPFLGDLTGWIVAIVVGLVLAGLAIPFYAAGVAVLGGVVAYLVTTGVMAYLGYGLGTLSQAAGIIAGAVAIILIYLFRVHRLLVIAVTAAAGAGAILAGVLVLLGRLAFDAASAADPTAVIRSTPLWLLLAIVLFLAGIGAQWSIRSRPSPQPAPAASPSTPPTAPAAAEEPTPAPAPEPPEAPSPQA